MVPRYRLVPPRRPARHGRAWALALLIGLAAGATGPARAGAAALADPTTSDTLSTGAGGESVPPATSGPPLILARDRFDVGIGADRLSHLSLGLAIGIGVGLSSREPGAGAAAVVTLAVAKELLDDRFDHGDLAAGAVGAGLAWLIATALTR